MSGRAYRVLLEQQAAEANREEEESEESEEEVEEAPKRAFNPFLLLAEEEEEEIEEEEEEEVVEEQVVQVVETKKEPQETKSKKKKNKKNKKKKNKKTAAQQAEDALLDAAVKEAQQAVEEEVAVADALLGVDVALLNPAGELKRLFGAQAVRTEATTAGARQRKGRKGGRQQQRGAYHRQMRLCTPLSTWPLMQDQGLAMKDVTATTGAEEAGITEYKVEHSLRYEMVQETFKACVESGDPNTIMDLLRNYPYHVPALLQMAEFFKQTGDYQQAGDFVERALYAFEAGWHPCYDWAGNTSRLRACHFENQALFQALFRHIQMLGRRGCCRTGLECCKLLLSFDHSDPLFVTGTIDYFALRSKQFAFLERFCDEFEGRRTLLPNLWFSRALSAFFFAQEEVGEEEEEERDVEKEMARADELLQRAVLAFPAVLAPLLAKCNTSLYRSDGTKIEPAQEILFSGAYQPASLMRLVSLYVDRCYSLWTAQPVVTWMARNVLAAIARMADVDDKFAATIEEEVRQMFPLHGAGPMQGIQAADYNDEVAAIPQELLQGGVLQAPLQPPPPAVVPAATNNPLALFFQTLMPWNDVPNAPFEGEAGGAMDVEQLQGMVQQMQLAFNRLRGAAHDEAAAEGAEEAEE